VAEVEHPQLQGQLSMLQADELNESAVASSFNFVCKDYCVL
jgi:hypothetical protein